ncbi:hypothetical protein ONZ45_g4118 [Pleurotus djamor]|nr:hypothetical protein ONZ45_g4118 [Pleurotus djamor]
MFFNPALVVAAIATLAVATPAQRRNEPASSCATDKLQCCNSVQDSKSSVVSVLFALLGINAQGVTGQVGVTCSPITVIGAGSAACNAQTVCCDNNTFNGVVSLGCSPVNLSL